MQQEDSNGSSSFEIIDKKAAELAGSNDKSDTLSTLSAISSPHSILSPSPTGSGSLSATGNILSNVAPPTSIPDFTLWTTASSSTLETKTSTVTAAVMPPQMVQPSFQGSIPAAGPIGAGQFPTTQFSPAIPPSKGIPQEATSRRTSQPPEAEVADTPGIIGLVQGAFSNGVLSKMAEKAKSSVNSLITTLDPQMSEYLYSGGDLEITVTTTDEEILSAIREVVHNVLGKAWVNGINLNLPQSQAVGLTNGFKNAEAKVASSYKQRETPTVAVENVLINENESWFDVTVLLLKDPEKGIALKTISQATPVPAEKLLEQANLEKKDPSASIEKMLSEYLMIIPGWQEEVSGVSRREIILLAAKTLVKLYKDQLNIIKPK